MSTDVRCRFYLREPREGGQWRYKNIWLPGYDGGGCLVTPHPPAVGDLIHLWDYDDAGPRGTFEVLARSWLHSAYGSANWPLGKPAPSEGPQLDLVVTPAEGLFRDEAELTPDEIAAAE